MTPWAREKREKKEKRDPAELLHQVLHGLLVGDVQGEAAPGLVVEDVRAGHHNPPAAVLCLELLLQLFDAELLCGLAMNCHLNALAGPHSFSLLLIHVVLQQTLVEEALHLEADVVQRVCGVTE